MKRVLVFGITDNPGGVEAVIMNYYRCFDAKKVQCDFLCNTEKVAYEEEIKKRGGKIFRVTARSVDPARFKRELTEFFEKNAKNYDVFWMNVCSLANIEYIKLAKKFGIKRRIIHGHNSENMDSRLRGLLHLFNKKQIAKYATDFWICAYDSLDWFYPKSIKKSGNYKIINNAIDFNTYKFDAKIRNEYRKQEKCGSKTVIGNVGRLHFQKNQMFLLDVFDEYNKLNPDSVLWLVGDGPDKEMLKEKVAKLGLGEKVKFLGSRPDVPKLLQAMDIFLFPSVFEGFGIAAIEAQCAGLPTFTIKDALPNTAKITDKFFELQKTLPGKRWAEIITEQIQSMSDENRRIPHRILVDAGLDIKVEAKKVEDDFCNE